MPKPTDPSAVRIEWKARIGEAMRARRVELDVDVDDLAAAAGVKPRMIRYYESGQHEPTVTVAMAIARKLSITVEELAGLSPAVVPLEVRELARELVARLNSSPFIDGGDTALSDEQGQPVEQLASEPAAPKADSVDDAARAAAKRRTIREQAGSQSPAAPRRAPKA